MLIIKIFVNIIGSIFAVWKLIEYFKSGNRLTKLICGVLFICFVGLNVFITITDYNKFSSEITNKSESNDIKEIYISENYSETIIDSRSEQYYKDLEDYNSKYKNKSNIMYILSFIVSLICIFLIISRKISLKTFFISIISILIIYNMFSVLFIMPVEIPTSSVISIPSLENVTHTILGDNRYKTETTTIITGRIANIFYYGEKEIIYKFKEILIAVNIYCVIISLISYIMHGRNAKLKHKQNKS